MTSALMRRDIPYVCWTGHSIAQQKLPDGPSGNGPSGNPGPPLVARRAVHQHPIP